MKSSPTPETPSTSSRSTAGPPIHNAVTTSTARAPEARNRSTSVAVRAPLVPMMGMSSRWNALLTQ
jgi:hypothetical protein